ncbi:MAG: AAA family ATPase [Chloroflexaceae bacterium]|nr:AAA family ATPase [Chloroflexaceae bacterium]
MITLIEALNFRCLRYVRQPLAPFQVLVGPNASGKTTFLDVVAFLGRLVSDGLEAALTERTQDVQDLVWQRSGTQFELALEMRIPDERRSRLSHPDHDTIRYEVAIGMDADTAEVAILAERALLKMADVAPVRQQRLFPDVPHGPATIQLSKQSKKARTVLRKIHGGNDNFYSEVTSESGKGWMPAFKFGPRKSALANLPADETKFPVSSWLKEMLTSGIQQLMLNSLLLREMSRPGQGRGFRPDGANLPWVVADLQQKDPLRFGDWIAHVQTALPDLEDIHIRERPDNRHRYLVLYYRGGLEVPSWVASDGTLRLLALTLPAYLTDFEGIYLIEEPENGIHPRAIETLFQSLSSVYDAQILLATHSPVILSVVRPAQVLCFAKTADGATDIIAGNDHPALRDWRGETSLSVLFAAGVLG